MRATRGAALALLALAACHHQVRPDLPERAAPPPQIDTRHDEKTLRGVYHVVQPGESLYRLARAYGTTPEALAQANGIADPRDLPAGLKLFVPGATQEVPVPAPELDGAVVDEASAGDPSPHHAKGCEGARCLAWPLRGVIYARFGARAGESVDAAHEGLDLAAPEGTPIAAAADGTVLYAGAQKGYGTLVILQHPGGLITLYAHNLENLVRDGQKVRAGQIIAKVGTSGRTSGPHCHFEVRRGSPPVPVDPLLWLPPPSSLMPEPAAAR